MLLDLLERGLRNRSLWELQFTEFFLDEKIWSLSICVVCVRSEKIRREPLMHNTFHAIHSFFFIGIYFIRISRLKFAKF